MLLQPYPLFLMLLQYTVQPQPLFLVSYCYYCYNTFLSGNIGLETELEPE